MKTPQVSAVKRRPAGKSRLLISIRGVVQGVGFRPFVYQLASKYRLNGWVRNTSGDVQIEVEGAPARLDRFLAALPAAAPPLARIEHLTATPAKPAGYDRFEIQESVPEEGRYQLVSPDIATCHQCRDEVLSPGDRRYRYPFTNCTNCGPRFTIIEDIPYDRPKTTMRRFQMCPDCQREYENPRDRRFHAQPNACPRCGPRLELVTARGTIITGDAITRAAEFLCEGKIVAVKGLGGFLLACDATSAKAAKRLRRRKRRGGKPFALMLATIDEIKQHCVVNAAEEALLTSPQCPIVLLERRPDSGIADTVAPGLKYLGLMLPYTPLHHLLCREAGRPLVMTSGNLSEEPIAKDNDEARRRLSGIADYFLRHDRDIYSRYDDSVTMVVAGKPQVLRRARGYAPHPVRLPFPARQVLACGAELKNTFCLTRDEYAFVSQHIGDMENLETLAHFEDTLALYEKLFRIKPEAVACDLHPDYLPTKYARELAEKTGLPLFSVQHHHAHAVGCLADNGARGPAISVSLDGTGYGTDGAIWGGEFLIADEVKFERRGCFQYVPLPGGAAAITHPYRMATSYLLSTLGGDALDKGLPFLRDLADGETALLQQQITRGINAPLTSSCGRLFDAVAALNGFRGRIAYEAEAAIALEMMADESETAAYPFDIKKEAGVHRVLFPELFAAILSDRKRRVPRGAIAMKFHNTVVRIVTEMCRRLSRESGLKTVALSGGVFQNRLLLKLTVPALEKTGFTVLTHRQVPANDGGISLGQAVVGHYRLERGETCA
ncbi:MAG: carbamoyltransferase HypF [Chloroflexota bacterium]